MAPKADAMVSTEAAFGVKADLPTYRAPAANDPERLSHCESSLDHLVGAAKQCDRQSQAHCLGDLEVDDKCDLALLHYREVADVFALQHTSHIGASLTVDG